MRTPAYRAERLRGGELEPETLQAETVSVSVEDEYIVVEM